MEIPRAYRFLENSVTNSPDVLLQFLLAIRRESTLKRIIRCPTYPVPVFDSNLKKLITTFHSVCDEHLYKTPDLFARLFEKALRKEERKIRGTYFTPFRIADKIIRSLELRNGVTILEPGCGTGVFPSAILSETRSNGLSISYIGVENDPIAALCTAVVLDVLEAPESWKVLYENYLRLDKSSLKSYGYGSIDLIIGNPPYVRFQKLKDSRELKKIVSESTNVDLTGFSGIHSYFVAISASLISPKGRMLFLLPSEMNGAGYGRKLLQHLNEKYEFTISKIDKPQNRTPGSEEPSSPMLTRFFTFVPKNRMSRPKRRGNAKSRPGYELLETFASVHRGISTGANHFFTLTNEMVRELKINRRYLTRIVPTKIPLPYRTLCEEEWKRYKRSGKRCWLLVIPKEKPIGTLSDDLRRYVRRGIREGVPLRPTFKSRDPWYSVPLPPHGPPDFIFTYIYRGIPRFVFNEVGAYILTNLLGVYLRDKNLENERENIAAMLNEALQRWIKNHDELDNPVGRKYSAGFAKIEPGDLMKMPMPSDILRTFCGASDSDK